MYRRAYLLTLLCFSVMGCSSSHTETLHVDHYMEECNSFFTTLCKRVRSNTAEEFNTTGIPIRGFEYEWGYVYELEVDRREDPDPLADGSSIFYLLVNVKSRVRESVDTVFNIYATDATRILNESPQLYNLYGGRTFTCEIVICTELENNLSQEFAMLFEFSHPENDGDPMILNQILCSSSKETFFNLCLGL